MSGSKSNTGRVVAWRELGIRHSFTLEASFAGAGDNHPNSHFHPQLQLQPQPQPQLANHQKKSQLGPTASANTNLTGGPAPGSSQVDSVTDAEGEATGADTCGGGSASAVAVARAVPTKGSRQHVIGIGPRPKLDRRRQVPMAASSSVPLSSKASVIFPADMPSPIDNKAGAPNNYPPRESIGGKDGTHHHGHHFSIGELEQAGRNVCVALIKYCHLDEAETSLSLPERSPVHSGSATASAPKLPTQDLLSYAPLPLVATNDSRSRGQTPQQNNHLHHHAGSTSPLQSHIHPAADSSTNAQLGDPVALSCGTPVRIVDNLKPFQSPTPKPEPKLSSKILEATRDEGVPPPLKLSSKSSPVPPILRHVVLSVSLADEMVARGSIRAKAEQRVSTK